LTAAGGLGLSQTIVTQVAAQEGLGETLAEHPEIMGPRFRSRLAPNLMTRSGLRPKAPESAGSAEAALSAAAPEAADGAGSDPPAAGG
jgi:hypothetical protein